MNKKTVRDVDVSGKTVLLRVDYNVPFESGSMEILDDSRLIASIPTIQYLLERECKLVLCSHLGRPKGNIVDNLKMKPIARKLSELLSHEIYEAPSCVGEDTRAMVNSMPNTGIVLLENVRFHPEEELNDPKFAMSLASLAEVYVNDAFGTAHRAHASTEGVAHHLPAVAGLLMDRELEMLGRSLDSPIRPFTALVGGAKVADKIKVLTNLSQRVDNLIVGGGMAATFLKASGISVGSAVVEKEFLSTAGVLMENSSKGQYKLILPVDLVVADKFEESANPYKVDVDKIPDSSLIMDIGPKTIDLYNSILNNSKTVLWNGTMGVFEWESFSCGTSSIANTIAELKDAVTVVGGGSTAEAVFSLNLNAKMTHVSTGGGASLEFLEDSVLPGVSVLLDKEE
ncbi:MAG: phosphoglycerate kinase [Chloroflexota bacterium]|nr:phosphoglycerate kinase [Chloroflexota bacterium]